MWEYDCVQLIGGEQRSSRALSALTLSSKPITGALIKYLKIQPRKNHMQLLKPNHRRHKWYVNLITWITLHLSSTQCSWKTNYCQETLEPPPTMFHLYLIDKEWEKTVGLWPKKRFRI